MSADEIRDALAKMTPLLDALPDALEPAIKRATQDLYYRLMTEVQDYIKDNAEWNIQAQIDTAKGELRQTRAALDEQIARADKAEAALRAIASGADEDIKLGTTSGATFWRAGLVFARDAARAALEANDAGRAEVQHDAG